jgi:hypothetical protein
MGTRLSCEAPCTCPRRGGRCRVGGKGVIQRGGAMRVEEEFVHGSAVLYRLLWMCGFCSAMVLTADSPLPASEGTISDRSPRIIEVDLAPQSRSSAAPQPMDAYLTTLQDLLRQEAASMPQPGLIDVRLTIRRDGVVEFAEVVPLDGPAMLRDQFLSRITALGPLPPPPITVDKLLVTLVLPIQYPGDDLLDAFGEERRD